MTQMKFNTLSCIDNPDEKLRARRVSPVRIDQSISLIDINALKDWPDLCIESSPCRTVARQHGPRRVPEPSSKKKEEKPAEETKEEKQLPKEMVDPLEKQTLFLTKEETAISNCFLFEFYPLAFIKEIP